MAIRQHYEIEDDTRKFDSPVEAVEAASEASVDRGYAKVRIYRVVYYTNSTEPTRTTLNVIQIPPGITSDMFSQPSADMGLMRNDMLQSFQPTVGPNGKAVVKPCFNCGRK